MKGSNAALKAPGPPRRMRAPIDFDELPTYVGYLIRRTQTRIFGEFEATLADFDFTPGSFGVLTVVRANPGITQVVLAAAFGVDKSTMSPVVVRLEKRGLIRREVLSSDQALPRALLRAVRGVLPSWLPARRCGPSKRGIAARLTKGEQRELWRGCWASCRRRQLT